MPKISPKNNEGHKINDYFAIKMNAELSNSQGDIFDEYHQNEISKTLSDELIDDDNKNTFY